MERRVRQQHVLQETSDNVQQLRLGRFEFPALNQSNGSERVRMRLRVQIQIVIVAAGATESTLLQAGPADGGMASYKVQREGTFTLLIYFFPCRRRLVAPSQHTAHFLVRVLCLGHLLPELFHIEITIRIIIHFR